MGNSRVKGGLTILSGRPLGLIVSLSTIVVIAGAGVTGGYFWGHSSVSNHTKANSTANTTHVIKTITSGVSTDISDVSTSGNKEFQFVITNSSKSTPFNFTFTGSHAYSFSIKNSSGKVVYSSSGGQVNKNSTLSPSKSVSYNLDITKEYKKLSDGEYTLDVVSTATNLKGITTSISFTKGGSQPSKPVTTIVTFVSKEGSNSFEATTSKGIKDIYYFSSSLGSTVTHLKDQQKVQLTYQVKGNDKYVSSIKVLKK